MSRAATSAAGIPLIDDEVLSDLGFPGERVPPPLAAFGDSVMSVGSLSKTIWAGLRIGWVRAPSSRSPGWPGCSPSTT